MPFMPHTRPSAWALIGVLLATMLFSAEAAPVAFAKQPRPTCTGWADDLHPPDVIRVLRARGPDKGHVQLVDFWTYVSVVMRAEYSTGADKPPLWMRIGAITVKQYGWFYAMNWRGGHATWTNADGTTSTSCYDVKDNTNDQIYKPQETYPDGAIYSGNIPTPQILKAMRETWHITLRKWVVTKSKSRLFLTGYRSGRKAPCGADSTGFKIYQQSLRDCMVKQLTTYETLRRYFEPTFIVNTRDHDVLTDGGAWRGDLGVLSTGQTSGTTQWRLYAGGSDAFAQAVTGTIPVDLNSLVGYGTGNVDNADPNGAADASLLADLVMVTSDSVLVARANGDGLSDSLISTGFSGSAPRQIIFGDFNGDLLTDVGLLRSDGTATLQVMLANGDGTFGAPQDWWTGPLDLGSALFVAAGDVNGDGRADLIARDGTGAFQTALSAPSCSDFSVWGACPAGAVGAPGLGVLNQTPALPGLGNEARLVVGDYDRDGREDILVVATDGTSISGLRGNSDGTFSEPQTLWTGTGATGQPIALNVNPDGMSDLAFVGDGAVSWFRTVEKSTLPASMTPMTSTNDSSLSTSSHPF